MSSPRLVPDPGRGERGAPSAALLERRVLDRARGSGVASGTADHGPATEGGVARPRPGAVSAVGILGGLISMARGKYLTGGLMLLIGSMSLVVLSVAGRA